MSEKDMTRLRIESVAEAPNIAIRPCVGRDGKFASGHRPFVIRQRAKSGERELWTDEILAEYDTLDEANQYPEAQSFFSSTVCSACRKLKTG